MRLPISAAAAVLLAASPALAQGLEIPEGGFVVSEDVSLLPHAVQSKRADLLAIAASGNLDSLGPLLEADQTVVSFGDPEDKIAYLRANAGDPDGIQMLAILAELLEAPYAAMDGGDGEPIYVWPYLAAYDGFQGFNQMHKVDALKLVTPEQYDEMAELGAWYYWRVSIGPEGNLQAFVAGD